MKRIFLGLISLLPLMAVADDVVITTAAQLRSLAAEVNAGNSHAGTTVRLAADIDLGGVAEDPSTYWTPIGTMSNPFCGTFDGQGHWLSNLRVDISGSQTGNVAGLFGCIGSEATVMHVGVQSGNIYLNDKIGEDADCYIGGIVGLNRGTIRQCANKAMVVAPWNMAHAGGIAGACGNVGGGATAATIQDCYNEGTIYGDEKDGYVRFLGGIVGVNYGTVSSVWSSGTVSPVTYSDDICASGTVSNASSGSTQTGTALDGTLNTQGDYSVWTFADGVLPQLTCFVPTDIALEDGTDNQAVLDQHEGRLCNVTLQGRTLYKDGSWNTLCLPFALSSLSGTPLEGATLMSLASASLSEGTLTLNFTPQTAVEAGRPYIVKWDSGTDLQGPVFQRVTLSSSLSPTVNSGIAFSGTYSPVTLDAGDRQTLYLGADNTLYYPSAQMTVGACRAFFRLSLTPDASPEEEGNKVRAFVLRFDDDPSAQGDSSGENVPTGIEGIVDGKSVNSKSVNTTCDWFTLQGVRLPAPPATKGIYIKDGKKIVLK
jgi:hypothetical protein